MTEKQRVKHRREFFEAVHEGRIEVLTDIESFGKVKKGDLVKVLNGYDCEVGPFEILGFTADGKMFLDWDCYWFAIKADRVVKILNRLTNKNTEL